MSRLRGGTSEKLPSTKMCPSWAGVFGQTCVPAVGFGMAATPCSTDRARRGARSRRDSRRVQGAGAPGGWRPGARAQCNCRGYLCVCVCPPSGLFSLSGHSPANFLGTAASTWSKRQATSMPRADLRQAAKLRLSRRVHQMSLDSGSGSERRPTGARER